MTTLDNTNQACTQSLKLLGDFWTLRIVDALSDGPLRYCALQRAAGDVNPVTFTTKLKKLEGAGVVLRTQGERTDVVYCLTELGQEILPVLAAMDRFAKQLAVTKPSVVT